MIVALRQACSLRSPSLGWQIRSGCRQASNVAKSSTRQLWRWGRGQHAEGELSEASAAPQLVEEVVGVSAVACGPGHSAFVVDGQLFTFGSNANHKLGRTSAGSDLEFAPVLVEASDGHQPAVAQISLGANHSAVVTEGGVLWTWGFGGSFWYGSGALGLGKARGDVASPRMVTSFVRNGLEIQQVACGGLHTLALDSLGTVFAAGRGSGGCLGLGGMAAHGDAKDFEELLFFKHTIDSVLNPGQQPQIVKIDAGLSFSAALSEKGEIWVWGKNDYGQLGVGRAAMAQKEFAMKYPFLMRNLPMEGHAFQDLACGDTHVIAVSHAGVIFEWGRRQYFDPTSITIPSRYKEGLKGVVKLAAGDRCSFALTSSGELYSWGEKSTGCLALGDSCEDSVRRPTLIPPEVFGNQPVVDIAVSGNRCLAITEGR